MLSRAVAFFAALGLLFACGTPPPDPECSATKACSAGYACVSGKCEFQSSGAGGGGFTCPENPAKSPPNMLDNPNFECGDPPTKWSQGFFGTLTKAPSARTGSGAARWTANVSPDAGTVAYFLSSDIEAPVSEGQRLCAAAYVRGTGQNAIIRMRVVTNVGTTIDQQSFAQFLTPNWARIVNNATVEPGYRGVVYGVGLRAPTAGQYIEVDDAEMWVSNQPDGGCDQRN